MASMASSSCTPIYSKLMRIVHCLFVSVIFITSTVVQTQDSELVVVPNSALCSEASTCNECMIIHPSCAWCMQAGFDKTDNYDRCDTMENLRLRGCSQGEIEIGPGSTQNYKGKPLSEKGDTGDIVQVAPQKVTIRTRPGLPVALPQMTVRQAEDFPVDLYFIMDLSQSMADDLENLKDLGDKLAEVMGNITTNFRLGYGAFVDKLVMPYADVLPSRLQNPCLGGVYCDPPFGFKNVLSLTTETDQFARAIARVNASGNLDSPEGGLDALMQATVCKENIGWRTHARHLLLYSTDAPFHIAGDGLLGGIVTRNDGQCHTDSVSNVYTKATELDYPSISQLSVEMQKHGILPIFAIGRADGVAIDAPSDPYRFYKDLPLFFHESAVARLSSDSKGIVELVKNVYLHLPSFFHESQVTRLSSDSGDIVQVVKNVYLNITAGVKVEDKAPRDAFQLNYTAICLDGVPQQGIQECTGLQLGDDVFFNITLTMNKTVCASKKRKHTFQIGPTAFNEFMTVEVEAICECDCAIEELRGPDVCNGTGSEVCGGCICDEGWSGSNCDCNRLDSGTVDMECVWNVTGENPIDDPVECSNRGICNCGECKCNNAGPGKRYFGTHCQCDDFSCPRYKNEICGGPSRGVCMCNETFGFNYCNCTENYIGERCECPKDQEGCRSPDGSICNNVGFCDCGNCTCNDSSKYRGPTCSECSDCPRPCEEHKPCVQCKAFNSGEFAGTVECDECPHNITVLKELLNLPGSQECVFKDDDDCLFVFRHLRFPNGTYYIEVTEDKVCPDKSAILWMIIGIVVGILLVGIALLLIWRLLTFIHDRREFKNFEKERANARWEAGENPIYRPSTSVFKNPTYGK